MCITNPTTQMNLHVIFVEKQGLCWIINSELPGAIVTMHDYLAGVVKDEIEAQLKP